MRRWIFTLLLSCSILHGEDRFFPCALVVANPSPRRQAFPVDPVAEALVSGHWNSPTNGQPLSPSITNHVWEYAGADTNGVFSGAQMEGGYLRYLTYAESNTVRLLSAAGADVMYVNGEPHVGDPYFNETVTLPVLLHKGSNEFLFAVSRGRFRGKLSDPPRPVSLYQKDPTLPDIIRGENDPLWAAVIVMNATTNPLTRLNLRASAGGRHWQETTVPIIPPLSIRKVGFQFKPRWDEHTNALPLCVELRAGGKTLDSNSWQLNLRRPDEHYKQTFRSDIDGSVQYFAVAPAIPLPGAPPPRALFLSVHGASVEATSQAGAYQSKHWGTVVAPTNRRPYGLDWEDWGQADAMEVLGIATNRFDIDPHEVYLTGHSMGGHGTWHLGTTFPDQFAAIAPSAGWISFWSYAGSEHSDNPDPMAEILQRASNPGDTLGLVSNCLHFGVYILHGTADDNVPVKEARTMRDRLAQFHSDTSYYEQPGAGHWWGNQCVDWPPLFDFLSRHRRPDDADVLHINFTTMNPGASARSHWISIEQQIHPLQKSVVIADYDSIHHAFKLETENVTRLQLRAGSIAAPGPVTVKIDTNEFSALPDAALSFALTNGQWSRSGARPAAQKGPGRYGPFKDAIGHEMQFVYATHGTPEENAWALAKARFDAETWWYRANGSVDVIPDSVFNANLEPDRGIVLYGNADNNSAWPSLLGDSPIQVRRDGVSIESHTFGGTDLASLFCRPRHGSDVACVAVVSGTGVEGDRMTDRIPYMTAGVAYPDCVVFGASNRSDPNSRILAAGYFGMDWSVATGDFVFRPKDYKRFMY